MSSAAVVTPGNVVISGAFGGGGNSGPSAYYANDFVQLFNRSNGPVNMTGYSIQYTPPTTGTTAWTEILPNTTLKAGQSFLFEGNGSGQVTAAGTEPTADLSFNSGTVDIKRDSWTLYLVSKTTRITGDTDPAIVDELGVGPALGTTPAYAAGNPAPAVSNTTAALRKGGGCTDTNNNSADFSIVTTSASTPFPFANTATTPAPCASVASASLPEAPYVPLLGLTGLAAVGVATIFVRRRRSA